MSESEDVIKPFEFLQNIDRAIEAGKINENMTVLLVHYMTHQFDDWIFNDKTVAKKVHLCSKVVAREKNRLEKLGIVSLETAYEKLGDHTSGRKGTYIKVNYFWQFDNGSNKVPSNKVPSNQIPSNEVPMNSVPTLIKNIGEQGIHGSKEEGEQVGGQAAPAPSESAAQKSSAEGSHSTGEIDLLKESAPLPEKPKKERKGKPKAAGQIEIPEVEEIKIYIAGYIQENYEQRIHNYVWTDWELTETAKDIQEAIPKYKWKDWKQGARNWIRNSKPIAFKPKMTDPARYTGNQPQRQQLAGQKKTEAEIMAVLTGRNTTQETFETESNRISQNLEISQK